MNKALLPAVSLALCLIAAGCTDSDWNRMLNYGGVGAEEAAPSPPPVEAQAAAAPAAPALPSNADFC